MLRDYPCFPFDSYDLHKKRVLTLYAKVSFMARFIHNPEAVALYELARGLHSNFQVDADILEFGTFCGAATVAMNAGIEARGSNKQVYTIDHNHWHNESVGIAEATFRKLGFNRNICQIVSEFTAFFEKFWRYPISLVFQDAVSSYDLVFKSLEMCFPFIIDDGWMAVHDYNNGNIENVVNAVNEFIDSGGYHISAFRTESLICLKKHGQKT